MKNPQKRKYNTVVRSFISSGSDVELSLCIIGLGNPGYDDTRHNVGFQFVDAFAAMLGEAFKKEFFTPYLTAVAPATHIAISSGQQKKTLNPIILQDDQVRFQQIILVKPLTYINKSGLVIPHLLRKYGTDLCFLVVADNMDLPLGAMRLKKRGGTAGHNGLKSIMEYLGKNFYPLYIGVGRPKSDVISHVLGTWNKEEQDLCDKCIVGLVNILVRLFSDDLDTIIQLVNSYREDFGIPV